MSTADLSATQRVSNWRTPFVIIACGCAIALLSFGPRSTVGFFVQPMSREFAWGRDVFSLAIAVQNLLWGLGQPWAGDVRRCAALCRRSFADALCRDAAVARSWGRRSHRLRAVRLLVQSGAV